MTPGKTQAEAAKDAIRKAYFCNTTDTGLLPIEAIDIYTDIVQNARKNNGKYTPLAKMMPSDHPFRNIEIRLSKG